MTALVKKWPLLCVCTVVVGDDGKLLVLFSPD